MYPSDRLAIQCASVGAQFFEAYLHHSHHVFCLNCVSYWHSKHHKVKFFVSKGVNTKFVTFRACGAKFLPLKISQHRFPSLSQTDFLDTRLVIGLAHSYTVYQYPACVSLQYHNLLRNSRPDPKLANGGAGGTRRIFEQRAKTHGCKTIFWRDNSTNSSRSYLHVQKRKQKSLISVQQKD